MVDFFSELCYYAIRVIFTLIHYLQTAFMILAGGENIGNAIEGVAGLFDEKGQTGNTGNILYDLLFGYWVNNPNGDFKNNEMVGRIFMIFFVISVSFFAVAIAFATFRTFFSTDRQGALKKVIIGSLKTIFYFFGVPILFFLCIKYGTELIQIIIRQVGNVVGEDTSIAENFFKACYVGEIPAGNEQYISIVNCDFKEMEQLLGKGSLNIFANKFQYIIAGVAGCMMLYSMFIATFGLAERLINICLLYVISPVVVATITLDDGERLKTWKDLVLAKFLGAMGNILSMYLFIVLINYWGNMNNLMRSKLEGNFELSAKWIVMLLYLIIGCGGGLVMAKGSNLVASIISQKSGENDGLSQIATNQLTQGATRLAKAVGAGVLGAVFGKKASSGGSNVSPLSQNSSGGGSSGGDSSNSLNPASMTNGQGGFQPNDVVQSRNSLATNGGSGGLKSNLMAGGKSMLRTGIKGAGIVGAGLAITGALSGALVAGAVIATVASGAKVGAKAGAKLFADHRRNKKTINETKMSGKEAKNVGLTKSERKEFNSNASALAESSKLLNKAYNKEDKLERKANNLNDKVVQSKQKSGDSYDTLRLQKKHTEATDKLNEHRQKVATKKTEFDNANKKFNASQTSLDERKQARANSRPEDYNAIRDRRRIAKTSSPKAKINQIEQNANKNMGGEIK